MCPLYRREVWKNLHFSGESFSPYSFRWLRTFGELVPCFSVGFEKTVIPLRNSSTTYHQYIAQQPRNLLRAFVVPCSILLNSQKPLGHTKAAWKPFRDSQSREFCLQIWENVRIHYSLQFVINKEVTFSFPFTPLQFSKSIDSRITYAGCSSSKCLGTASGSLGCMGQCLCLHGVIRDNHINKRKE